MDPFDEWVKSVTRDQHASVHKYADKLIELGASWDSFKSARHPDTIANDLVQGGIPLLAARDIVDVATTAARQSQAPMAIFWDLENMPIPTTSSGRDVSSRLKSILKPYGDLVQFRGYASIGLNLIPQHKRSDLQLSGCLLVDCPHNGRKEVADKMIIVDAMNFVMLHPDGATLCFVTGDIDYAYLLAVLQRYKQYRTIVISKGTLQSMLDVNCDMKMRWETDILQLRSGAPLAWTNTHEDLGLAAKSAPETSSSHATSKDASTEGTDSEVKIGFEPLTADEEWVDDVEFLRTLLRREGASSVIGVRKSTVGNLLRQSNPARFPHRDAVKRFLAEVIDRKVVWETGEGAFKELGLPTDETTGMFPAILLSNQLPLSIDDIPDKVKNVALKRPYIIFVKWNFCPSGTVLPPIIFVHQKDIWGFLLFPNLTEAQRTVSDFPFLRNGILVDWRKAGNVNPSITMATAIVAKEGALATSDSPPCTLCRSIRDDVTLQRMDGSGDLACPECIAWQKMPIEVRNVAATKVVDYLQFFALNDDIRLAESILRKQLHLRKETSCQSRKWAALWIKHAIEIGLVEQVKSPTNKAKHVCLASELEQVSHPLPPDNMDTQLEEQHVVDILWHSEGEFLSRLRVIQSLRDTFPERMGHPYWRFKVFINAAQKSRFYLAKGTYGQFVGLTPEAAELGLASVGPQKKEEEITTKASGEAPEINEVDDEDADRSSSDDDSGEDEDALRNFVGGRYRS